MCCGKPLLAISDGHQNPKSPVTPPSNCPHAQSIIRGFQIPLANSSFKPFPKKVQRQKQNQQKQDQIRTKKSVRKLLIENSLVFSQMTCIQQHYLKNPFPHSVFLLMEMKGGKFPHGMNSTKKTYTEVLKTLLRLSLLKESDQQLLEVHFKNHVQKS